jgi:hypothetical protein
MIIGEFQKNTAELVKVSWETYKGVSFIDIRAYYEAELDEWKPTRKGIAISPDKIDTLIELLTKAKQWHKQKKSSSKV